MEVGVIVFLVVVAVAQFVPHAVFLFDRVNEFFLPEEDQGAENTGFVDGFQPVFQIGHGQGEARFRESGSDALAVGCRFDAVFLQQAGDVLCAHDTKITILLFG